MAKSRLRRFDVTAWRHTSATDPVQIPLAGARFDFYRQGATVKSSSITIAAGGGTATVDVYDVGSLMVGDTVNAGAGGPGLVVDSNGILGPTQVVLKNNGTSAVRLYIGTRLIRIAYRPIVYADPFGSSAIGDFLTTGTDGRALGYIDLSFDPVNHPELRHLDEERYDYVCSPASRPVLFDNATNWVITGAGPLSWSHTASGVDRFVLVGISWRKGTGSSDVLSGVTYAAIPMVLLATVGTVAVYYLVNPPLNSQQVVATWSGSGQKGAIGGAASFQGVDQSAPLGTAATAQGSSTAPSVNVGGVDALSLVFDLLGIDAGSSIVTVNPGSGQTQHWSASAGDTTNADLTQGASSRKAGSSGATASMGWTLGALRGWSALGVALKPAPLLVIDAEGAALSQPSFGIDVRDCQSLAAAIAALPATGGEVFLPVGEYLIDCPGLVITKPNVSLRGEGYGTIIRARASDQDMALIRATATQLRLSNLKLGKYDLGGGQFLTTDTCLWVDGTAAVDGIVLDQVQMEGAVSAGLRMSGSELTSLMAIGCRCVSNEGYGVDLDFTKMAAQFVGCHFESNLATALRATSGTGILRLGGCSFVANQGGLTPGEGNALDFDGFSHVEVAGCYFENPAGVAVAGEQFIRVGLHAVSAVVEGCVFVNPATGSRLEYCARAEYAEGLRFANNCALGPFAALLYPNGSSPIADLGNVGSPIAPSTNSTTTIWSMSQRVLTNYRYSYSTKPSGAALEELPQGSMIWIQDPPPNTNWSNLLVVKEATGGKEWWAVEIT